MSTDADRWAALRAPCVRDLRCAVFFVVVVVSVQHEHRTHVSQINSKTEN